MDKELMRTEALKRLDYLVANGMFPEAKEYFANGSPCYFGQAQLDEGMTNVLYLFIENPEFQQIIETIEKENNILVYCGIYNETPFGKILSLLYVDQYDEEWEMDTEDLENFEPLAYVYNIRDGVGEIGTIGIEIADVGLVRTF